MSNDSFLSENEQLIAESSKIINDYSFQPFMNVHCAIPEEEQSVLLAMNTENRVQATLKASRSIWNRERFQKFVDGTRFLVASGMDLPTLAKQYPFPPCCTPPTSHCQSHS